MIHYVVGDAAVPFVRPALIAHVCNNLGAWGAGFVLSLGHRYPKAEQAYSRTTRHYLGTNQYVDVENDIHVANMIAQRGYGGAVRRIVDSALEDCLHHAAGYAARRGMTIHMPRIGCGLAGAKWDEIEPIVRKNCNGVGVYVYDLPTP